MNEDSYLDSYYEDQAEMAYGHDDYSDRDERYDDEAGQRDHDDYWGIGNDCSEYDDEPEPNEDQFRDDVEADADALASAGFGTDEDYGYYGGGEDW